MRQYRILRVFLIPRVICFSLPCTPVSLWWPSCSSLAWQLRCSALNQADAGRTGNARRASAFLNFLSFLLFFFFFSITRIPKSVRGVALAYLL